MSVINRPEFCGTTALQRDAFWENLCSPRFAAPRGLAGHALL